MRDYVKNETNIKDFIGETIIIEGGSVDELAGITVTSLETDQGMITTTSEVIKNQFLDQETEGFPVRVSIQKKKAEVGHYLTFAPPA